MKLEINELIEDQDYFIFSFKVVDLKITRKFFPQKARWQKDKWGNGLFTNDNINFYFHRSYKHIYIFNSLEEAITEWNNIVQLTLSNFQKNFKIREERIKKLIIK